MEPDKKLTRAWCHGGRYASVLSPEVWARNRHKSRRSLGHQAEIAQRVGESDGDLAGVSLEWREVAETRMAARVGGSSTAQPCGLLIDALAGVWVLIGYSPETTRA